ncbi:MAG TPA: hypothetical protein VNN74_10415 [Candidatus Micrarchaeia archaeon]|nr:hypothetical protein [Candidatus Micrarchaeia archaeon]
MLDGGPPPDPSAAGAVPGRMRPLRFGELLDTVFTLYRRNFVLLVAVVAVVQVPFQALSALLPRPTVQLPRTATGTALSHAQTQHLLHDLTATVAVDLALLGLTYAVVVPLQTAAFTRAVADRLLGRTVAVGAVYRAALRRWLPLLGLGLLLVISLVAAIAVVAGLVFVLVVLVGPLGALVGVVLGVAAGVAAIITYVRLLFGSQVVVLEGLGPWRALVRSWRLTRGLAWRVAGVVVVLGLIGGVVSLVLGGLVAGIAAALGVGSSGATAVDDIGQAAVAILVAPILATGLTVLYFDHRVRREGFDLELLAAQLAGSSPAP